MLTKTYKIRITVILKQNSAFSMREDFIQQKTAKLYKIRYNSKIVPRGTIVKMLSTFE
jgi:hypothetical protein